MILYELNGCAIDTNTLYKRLSSASSVFDFLVLAARLGFEIVPKSDRWLVETTYMGTSSKLKYADMVDFDPLEWVTNEHILYYDTVERLFRPNLIDIAYQVGALIGLYKKGKITANDVIQGVLSDDSLPSGCYMYPEKFEVRLSDVTLSMLFNAVQPTDYVLGPLKLLYIRSPRMFDSKRRMQITIFSNKVYSTLFRIFDDTVGSAVVLTDYSRQFDSIRDELASFVSIEPVTVSKYVAMNISWYMHTDGYYVSFVNSLTIDGDRFEYMQLESPVSDVMELESVGFFVSDKPRLGLIGIQAFNEFTYSMSRKLRFLNRYGSVFIDKAGYLLYDVLNSKSSFMYDMFTYVEQGA